MANICVLGGGLVGRFVACSLEQRGHTIRLIDSMELHDIPSNIEVLKKRVEPSEIAPLVAGFEVVVNCLPGRIGHAVRKPLLAIDGMSVSDLAFTAEDPRDLDNFAKSNNSRLVYDVGIAPGLSNALLMHSQQKMAELQVAKIWVGGNPQQPDEDWSYMAPFSPSDVIEEYTRPARFRRDYTDVTEPALSERHIVDVPGYGEMEAFLTDGVRSLLDTIESRDLVEYTVRWPGHIQKYIDGNFSEKDLIEAWKFDENRPEFTWLRVLTSDGQTEWMWDIIDEGKGGWSSMARTTGLVTVEVAEMLSEGVFEEFGVMPAEYIGTDDSLLERVIQKLRLNGVRISESKTS